MPAAEVRVSRHPRRRVSNSTLYIPSSFYSVPRCRVQRPLPFRSELFSPSPRSLGGGGENVGFWERGKVKDGKMAADKIESMTLALNARRLYTHSLRRGFADRLRVKGSCCSPLRVYSNSTSLLPRCPPPLRGTQVRLHLERGLR